MSTTTRNGFQIGNINFDINSYILQYTLSSFTVVLTHSKCSAHGLSAALHSAASPRPHTPYRQHPQPSGARPSGQASWSRGHRTAAHPSTGHRGSLRLTAAAPVPPLSPDAATAIAVKTAATRNDGIPSCCSATTVYSWGTILASLNE